MFRGSGRISYIYIYIFFFHANHCQVHVYCVLVLCCLRLQAPAETDDPTCKHWLTSHCLKNAIAPQVKHIQLASDASIHIGNQVVHNSHNLFSYRGLLFCFKCGAFGSKKLNLLSKQCEQATYTGERALKYIFRGDKPPSLTEWPDESE